MDLKPHTSDDFSITVVQANSSLEDQSKVFTSPSATYVGVYDGHGGPEAFLAEQRGLSADVIKKAFDATEEEFLHLVKPNLGDSRAFLGQKASVDRRISMLTECLSTDQYFAVEEVRKEVEALHPDDSHILVYSHEVRQLVLLNEAKTGFGFYLHAETNLNRIKECVVVAFLDSSSPSEARTSGGNRRSRSFPDDLVRC
ncbi:probable protein phosphatase 2C 63 [Macadamia integrifolia]|uniref:probable protein phosphatase 2C 63 n=1 Tax=Macadamia integrifolia TaxID=60698 RepID=UPI001C5022DE|nr:probable protein phosphatase 2C 63 [Macadamia integrifolia]